MSMLKEIQAGKLNVKVFETRREMGEVSSKEVSEYLKTLLKEKDEVNIVFAAAPSQDEFLELLAKTKDIAWNRVNAFHMDEYLKLNPDAPQGFGNFLSVRLFDKLEFKSVHLLNGNAESPEEECVRYAGLLEKFPADIVCMGIGENGHIAFNDPPVADFQDKQLVKVVKLDQKCKEQQVHDGCFHHIDEVPAYAITLTIPALLAGGALFCIAPGKAKADAAKMAITGEISEACPASILRTHGKAAMYMDKDSAAGIL